MEGVFDVMSDGKDAGSDEGVAVLTYFQGRGRAETVRWALAAGGVAFRHGGSGPQPGGGMSTHEEFKELGCSLEGCKGEETPTSPFGQVPLLEVDGLTLFQTGAIVRYAARHGKLDGGSELEKAEVDAVCETVKDFAAPGIGWMFAHRAGRDMAELAKPHFARWIPRFERYIKNNAAGDGKHLVGASTTMADIVMAEAMQQYNDVMTVTEYADPAEFWAEYPCCRAVHEAVLALPRIDAYLKSGLSFPVQDDRYMENVDTVMGRKPM